MEKNNYNMTPERAIKILQMPRDWFNTSEKIKIYNEARDIAMKKFKCLYDLYEILQNAIITENILSENDEFIEGLEISREQKAKYDESKRETIEAREKAEKDYKRKIEEFVDAFGELIPKEFAKISDIIPDRIKREERKELKKIKKINNYKTAGSSTIER